MTFWEEYDLVGNVGVSVSQWRAEGQGSRGEILEG